MSSHAVVKYAGKTNSVHVFTAHSAEHKEFDLADFNAKVDT